MRTNDGGPVLTLLDSGYWHYRISAYQFIQWPRGRDPAAADGFGWIMPTMLHDAMLAAREREAGR